MSEIKVNKVSPRSGTNVQLGDSGDTITIPAGATFAGTQNIANSALTGSGTISPTNTTVGTQTLNGVSSSWTGVNSLPTWSQTVPGAATNFSQSYMGPGLQSVTEVDRTIQIQSVTESTSVFTQ